MLISDVFPDGRSLMFFNALIQVSACVADIIHIAQITLKMVYNALLVQQEGVCFLLASCYIRSLGLCTRDGYLFKFCDLILQVDLAQNWLMSGPLVIRDQRGRDPSDLPVRFKTLRKCQSKFNCLIYEKLFIKELKPTLNMRSDSIRAKLFL